MGAQKNFAVFAARIGREWTNSPDNFNESWYREAVAKAIVFKTTERIVSDLPWYQGGYRANIVAYAIAKTAHDIKERGLAVDFQGIWRQQAPSPEMMEALAVVAEAVHDILINPPPGISNVTEWAKKQACWMGVLEIDVSWPPTFLDDLISNDARRDTERRARRDQRELNGIEAQIAVVKAGSGFWSKTLEYGVERGLLTPAEEKIFRMLADGRKTPTDKQSLKAIEALRKLQSEGFPDELPPDS